MPNNNPRIRFQPPGKEWWRAASNYTVPLEDGPAVESVPGKEWWRADVDKVLSSQGKKL